MNLTKLISTIKQSEMNLSQLHILSVLEAGESYYYQEISRLTGCSETTCSKAMRDMEVLNLVERLDGKRNADNRMRMKKGKITRFGKALLRALRNAVESESVAIDDKAGEKL